MNEIFYLIPIFFLIALIYSSAGFGGGSSYLAILSLFEFSFVDLRMIALVCNIVVVTSSLFLFTIYDFVKWRKIFPFIILSVPLAFMGGSLRLDSRFFFLLLSGTLLVSAILMMTNNSTYTKKLPRHFNGIVGGGIGFLSGMVGIGGGIFLSPLLHLTRWDNPKVIAATSAAFILVNSIAGLTGQIYNYGLQLDWKCLMALVVAVICGGQIGARMTIFRFNPLQVRKITGFVILLVAIRILFVNL